MTVIAVTVISFTPVNCYRFPLTFKCIYFRTVYTWYFIIKKKIWQPVDFLGIVFPIFRVTKQTIDDINRLLYSIMYNMEIYCMSLYCIENPYWTRICIVLKTRIGQDARPIRVFNGINFHRYHCNKILVVFRCFGAI
jgi:hypothetical protein